MKHVSHDMILAGIVFLRKVSVIVRKVSVIVLLGSGIVSGCASQTAQEDMQASSEPPPAGDVTASVQDRHWVTTQEGCLVYSPNPIPGETLTWSGACVEGKASGVGDLAWYVDGEATGRYTGKFQDGERDGGGTYTHLAPAIPLEDLPTFTGAELATYDGQDGAPAYVAYNGRVYDVSHSFLWAGGEHEMSHFAGEDLTDSFERAPHGFENAFAPFPVVGLFVED